MLPHQRIKRFQQYLASLPEAERLAAIDQEIADTLQTLASKQRQITAIDQRIAAKQQRIYGIEQRIGDLNARRQEFD